MNIPRHFTLLALAACTLATEAAADFLPGEILVPDEFNSVVLRYSAAGVLLQTYSAPGQFSWVGSALTPGGDWVGTYRSPVNGVKVFDDSGLQLQSWTGTADRVNDVSVFANGTLALTLDNGAIERRTQAGVLLGSTAAGLGTLLGSTVGADDVLYFTTFNGGKLGRMNAAGVLLGTTTLGFTGGDVVSGVDGTLWVGNVDDNTIHHFTAAGVEIGTGFASGFSGGNMYGLGIAPDGQSLYATRLSNSVMRHLDLTGASLGDIALTGSSGVNLFFTVVPTPEPGSALLLTAGGGLLLSRRRRAQG
ncbi:MAG: PEP-CTERM sorting domain-containing protein [Chthoniobacter sp.]